MSNWYSQLWYHTTLFQTYIRSKEADSDLFSVITFYITILEWPYSKFRISTPRQLVLMSSSLISGIFILERKWRVLKVISQKWNCFTGHVAYEFIMFCLHCEETHPNHNRTSSYSTDKDSGWYNLIYIIISRRLWRHLFERRYLNTEITLVV